MNHMRDPAEVEAEERRKKEAQERKTAEKAAIFKTWYECYGKYFDFKHIMWLCEQFKRYAVRKAGVDPATIEPLRACNLLSCRDATSYFYMDVKIPKTDEGLQDLLLNWLEYRYRCNQALVEEDVVAAASAAGFSWADKDSWSFPDVVLMCWHYQNIFVKTDQKAGFGAADVERFQEVFDDHRGSYEELLPAKLWELLKSVSMEKASAKEQQYVLQVLDECDLNKNGMLSLDELLHLIRALLEDDKVQPRVRENRLLEKSGMELSDIEDWFGIFSLEAYPSPDPEETPAVPTNDAAAKAAAAGPAQRAGFINMANVKNVFKDLQVKWDKSESDKLRDWLKEVDEDFNGLIDFGEFCCLIQKMYDTNFAGLQSIKSGTG